MTPAATWAETRTGSPDVVVGFRTCSRVLSFAGQSRRSGILGRAGTDMSSRLNDQHVAMPHVGVKSERGRTPLSAEGITCPCLP